jgi:hypothetical protein
MRTHWSELTREPNAEFGGSLSLFKTVNRPETLKFSRAIAIPSGCSIMILRPGCQALVWFHNRALLELDPVADNIR